MTVSRRPRQVECPDADLATFVLAALDRQLAALTEIRQTLTAGRPSEPGARWYAAAGSVVAARRYAELVTAALRGVDTPIASSSLAAPSGSSSPAPATFSRRCATDDVPGISSMFGDRRSSQASATDIGVAPSRVATDARASDGSGENPPSGKYGT
jgi:hypothetical protein